MIKLYQFPPIWGLPNSSPFCLKLETYLRMARIPFEPVVCLNPRQAPKGKLPYIEDKGLTLSDSNFIIEHLKSAYGDILDRHLNTMEKAAALAFRRLLDENLYWCVVYARWLDEKGWEITREALFDKLPPVVRKIVPWFARRTARRQLHGQGMGRHNRVEIYKIGMSDLSALADFLGEKPFFLGNKPTTLDATAYGILANILWTPIKSPLRDWMQKHPTLIEFCQRVRDRFYLNIEDKQLSLLLPENDEQLALSGT